MSTLCPHSAMGDVIRPADRIRDVSRYVWHGAMTVLRTDSPPMSRGEWFPIQALFGGFWLVQWITKRLALRSPS